MIVCALGSLAIWLNLFGSWHSLYALIDKETGWDNVISLAADYEYTEKNAPFVLEYTTENAARLDPCFQSIQVKRVFGIGNTINGQDGMLESMFTLKIVEGNSSEVAGYFMVFYPTEDLPQITRHANMKTSVYRFLSVAERPCDLIQLFSELSEGQASNVN